MRRKDQVASDSVRDAMAGKCAKCGKTTHHYCFGCKRWLCNNRIRDNTSEGTPPIYAIDQVVLENGKPKVDSSGKAIVETVYGVNSCFQIVHKDAWDAYLKGGKTLMSSD